MILVSHIRLLFIPPAGTSMFSYIIIIAIYIFLSSRSVCLYELLVTSNMFTIVILFSNVDLFIHQMKNKESLLSI